MSVVEEYERLTDFTGYCIIHVPEGNMVKSFAGKIFEYYYPAELL